jgi:hypothetical protein
MTIVDDRGRLFGRFNVVDVVVAVFVLGLIPLLYGAAALFWSPQPRLMAIEPASVVSGPNARVTIRGEHLRPYMRVSFNTAQGKNFLFKSTREAEVALNDMPPGVYDVILYDVAQEQGRLPQALTVQPSPLPRTRMTLVGIFGNLDAARAAQLTPGTAVAGIGTIRKVGTPIPARYHVSSNGLLVEIPVESAVMLPAEVEGFCDVRPIGGMPYCQLDGLTVQATMLLEGELSGRRMPFQIDQVRGFEALAPVEVSVRFQADPGLIRQLRVGDVDRGATANPLASGAIITALKPQSTTGNDTVATLRLNAERGSNGWVYTGRPLRAGASMLFRSERYELNGLITTISPEWSAGSPQ